MDRKWREGALSGRKLRNCPRALIQGIVISKKRISSYSQQLSQGLTPERPEVISQVVQSLLCSLRLGNLKIGRGTREECGLLGYRNPVRTSQETHYVSATEPSQLMLCKI
jgi:hypothetical protein